MYGKNIRDIVIAKLDEYSPYSPSDDGPLVSDGDILSDIKPVYSYIDKFLPSAANEACMVLPLHVLIPEDAGRVRTMPNGSTGTIEVPDDYLRLHTLLMPSWTIPVHSVIREGHPLYEDQSFEFTRGTHRKPIVTETNGVLGYYSLAIGTTNHTPIKFLYIPVYDKANEYTDMAAEYIALNCAKKIFEVFNNADCINMVNSAMQTMLQTLSV